MSSRGSAIETRAARQSGILKGVERNTAFKGVEFFFLASFSAGKRVQSMSLSDADVLRLAKELKFRKFAGAIFVTTRGNHGFEEGALVFDAGVPVACSYEYHAFSKVFYGKDAFARFANACASPRGVAEVFEAPSDAVHSFLAENRDALYSPRDNELAKPLKRSDSFEEELRGAAVQKQSVLKKIGFKGL